MKIWDKEEAKITILVENEEGRREGVHMAEIPFISQVVAAARHHLSSCRMFMQTSGRLGSQLGSAGSSQSELNWLTLLLEQQVLLGMAVWSTSEAIIVPVYEPT